MVMPGDLGAAMPEAAIHEILAKHLKDNEGFTWNPRTQQMHSGGYAVANPPGAQSVEVAPGKSVRAGIKDAMAKNKDLLQQEGMMLGGWLDKETGKNHIEVSQVPQSLEEAMGLAKDRNEKAIFDLNKFEEIKNPHYKKPLDASTSLPKEEIAPTAWALAHHAAGTDSKLGWMQNIAKTNPELAARLHQTPELADKMYGEVSKYKEEWIDHLRSPEETQQHYQEQMAKSPDSAPWYSKWWPTLQKALGQDLGWRVSKASAALSSQMSPEREAYDALKALQLHGEGRPIIPETISRFSDVSTKAARAMSKPDASWVSKNPNKWIPSGIEQQKTSDYLLAKMEIGDRGAVDRHIIKYYLPGKSDEELKAIPDAVKEIIQGRMMDDARAAGVPTRNFQAAVWAHHTGYKPRYGELGATAEDWMKHHLATKPEFANLTQMFPGLQQMRNEGVVHEIGREAAGLSNASEARSSLAKRIAEKRAKKKGLLSE